MSSSPVKKKAKLEKGLKLTELPNEVLDIILHHLDFPSIVNLVNSENHSTPKLLTVVQEWECAECNTTIFDVSTATNGAVSLSIPQGAKPFLCGGACGRKSCGHHRCESAPGYTCPGCSKVECHLCMHQHIHCCATCSGKWPDGRYCTECQGTCDKECRLCRLSICQHHGNPCDKCGVVSCGFHDDLIVDKCDHCQTSLCGSCLDDVDGMWTCGTCKKLSCNAHGKGSSKCPEFHFEGHGDGWPICVNCCYGTIRAGSCDVCGVNMCGCCNPGLDKCDYCTTSICDICQEKDSRMSMGFCENCCKNSCNASGSGSRGCPVFENLDDNDGWPFQLCPDCNAVKEDNRASSNENSASNEGSEDGINSD